MSTKVKEYRNKVKKAKIAIKKYKIKESKQQSFILGFIEGYDIACNEFIAVIDEINKIIKKGRNK